MVAERKKTAKININTHTLSLTNGMELVSNRNTHSHHICCVVVVFSDLNWSRALWMVVSSDSSFDLMMLIKIRRRSVFQREDNHRQRRREQTEIHACENRNGLFHLYVSEHENGIGSLPWITPFTKCFHYHFACESNKINSRPSDASASEWK